MPSQDASSVGSEKDATIGNLVGNIEKGGDPNPDIEPATRADDFQTISLETLVRMKLNTFRRKDQVHLQDMISRGIVDKSWLEKYPEHLRIRLKNTERP